MEKEIYKYRSLICTADKPLPNISEKSKLLEDMDSICLVEIFVGSDFIIESLLALLSHAAKNPLSGLLSAFPSADDKNIVIAEVTKEYNLPFLISRNATAEDVIRGLCNPSLYHPFQKNGKKFARHNYPLHNNAPVEILDVDCNFDRVIIRVKTEKTEDGKNVEGVIKTIKLSDNNGYVSVFNPHFSEIQYNGSCEIIETRMRYLKLWSAKFKEKDLDPFSEKLKNMVITPDKLEEYYTTWCNKDISKYDDGHSLFQNQAKAYKYICNTLETIKKIRQSNQMFLDMCKKFQLSMEDPRKNDVIKFCKQRIKDSDILIAKLKENQIKTRDILLYQGRLPKRPEIQIARRTLNKNTTPQNASDSSLDDEILEIDNPNATYQYIIAKYSYKRNAPEKEKSKKINQKAKLLKLLQQKINAEYKTRSKSWQKSASSTLKQISSQNAYMKKSGMLNQSISQNKIQIIRQDNRAQNGLTKKDIANEIKNIQKMPQILKAESLLPKDSELSHSNAQSRFLSRLRKALANNKQALERLHNLKESITEDFKKPPAESATIRSMTNKLEKAQREIQELFSTYFDGEESEGGEEEEFIPTPKKKKPSPPKPPKESYSEYESDDDIPMPPLYYADDVEIKPIDPKTEDEGEDYESDNETEKDDSESEDENEEIKNQIDKEVTSKDDDESDEILQSNHQRGRLQMSVDRLDFVSLQCGTRGVVINVSERSVELLDERGDRRRIDNPFTLTPAYSDGSAFDLHHNRVCRNDTARVTTGFYCGSIGRVLHTVNQRVFIEINNQGAQQVIVLPCKSIEIDTDNM